LICFPGRESASVCELAERLQIPHRSAVGLVDRLVADKLMRRGPSTGDQRQVMVRLTRRGENVLEELSELHRAQLKALGPELRRMLALLGKL
jgi:DNA-binding MarR family transcriptional regulator